MKDFEPFIRAIIAHNPNLCFGGRELDQAELDLIKECRGEAAPKIVKPIGEFRDAFRSDGNEEARWIEHMDHACHCCGGSGHKDDVSSTHAAELIKARDDALDEAAIKCKKLARLHVGEDASSENEYAERELLSAGADIRAMKGQANE